MAPKNREEGERTQHEKGEGRMSLKKRDMSL